MIPPQSRANPDQTAGVEAIRLVGRNRGIAAYRSDGTVALMLAYDERDVTPDDLVPLWAAMEQALARLERDRPTAVADAPAHAPAAS